ACRVEHELGAMEREGRFCAFVRIDGFRAETVSATTGGEVVEGTPEAVPTEKPLEGALGPDSMLDLSGDGVGRELRLDERRGVERLLVPLPRRRVVPIASLVAGQAQHPLGQAALVTEPRK